MAIRAPALELAKGEDGSVLMGEEPVTLLAAQRGVPAAKGELRLFVVEPVLLEAFDGMTTLAERLSVRKQRTLPEPARVVRVSMAGGAQIGEGPESHGLTLPGGKTSVLALMAKGAIHP